MNYRTPRTPNNFETHLVDVGCVGIRPILRETGVKTRAVRVRSKNVGVAQSPLSEARFLIGCENCGYSEITTTLPPGNSEALYLEANCPKCKSRYSLIFKKL